MTSKKTPSNDVIFAARLTPHRSLSPAGFRLLITIIGAICFVIGAFFLMMGVWPVLGFMGLDFLLIYWAFKANFFDAKAYEDVEVSRHHVMIRKVTPRGAATDHTFPQFGTRLEIDRHEEIGITQMRVANRNKAVSFGYFLNPLDRESFAAAFQQAISMAKR